MRTKVPKASLETAWALFREVHFSTLSARSRAEYTSMVKLALADLPAEFDAGDIVRWHRHTLPSCRSFRPSYCNLCLAVVRSIVRRAAFIGGDCDLAAMFSRVPKIRAGVLAPRCPPRDLVARALSLARDNGERCWFLLAGLAGLRMGELMGLRATDWHPVNKVLRVERQRNCEHRKNRVPHYVIVDDQELAGLIEWTIAHSDALRPRMGWHKGKSDGYLFPWAEKRVELILRRLRTCLGATYFPRGLGWHGFRHWGASELAADGATAWEIQQWLGDRDPKMATLYVAMVRGETGSCVSRLARRIGKIGTVRRRNASRCRNPLSRNKRMVRALRRGPLAKGLYRGKFKHQKPSKRKRAT